MTEFSISLTKFFFWEVNTLCNTMMQCIFLTLREKWSIFVVLCFSGWKINVEGLTGRTGCTWKQVCESSVSVQEGWDDLNSYI